MWEHQSINIILEGFQEFACVSVCLSVRMFVCGSHWHSVTITCYTTSSSSNQWKQCFPKRKKNQIIEHVQRFCQSLNFFFSSILFIYSLKMLWHRNGWMNELVKWELERERKNIAHWLWKWIDFEFISNHSNVNHSDERS